uniref:Uncharacterized protein n=1 Tax=Trichuris muris TaxID=70415 RepID=A0A5S6QLT3_TRIMR
MRVGSSLTEPAIEAMLIGTVVCVTLLIAVIVTLLACGGRKKKKQSDLNSSSDDPSKAGLTDECVLEVKVEEPEEQCPSTNRMDSSHRDVEQAASLKLMSIRRGNFQVQNPLVREDTSEGPSLHLMTERR